MVDMVIAYVITFLAVYAVVLIYLHRSGILEKFNISAFGPLLMWRTKRGRKAIARVARRKGLWRYWGNVATIITYTFLVAIFLLLVWEAFIIVQIPPEYAPGPELIIGIPGLNPLIPVGYGILALAIGIVVHEFSHGILTRSVGVKIRSLGVIALIVPIGAFVEPDDDGLKRLSKKNRTRLYAVGPASNIVLAFVCALIFSFGFMSSVEPTHDGVVIQTITKGYPAEEADLQPWMLITGLQTDNQTTTKLVSYEDFSNFMAGTKNGENLTITYYFKGRIRATNATLEDKYAYYLSLFEDPSQDVLDQLEQFRGVGFLGLRVMSLREDVIEPQARPFKGREDPVGLISGALGYVSLPILSLSPMPPELEELMVVTGPLSFLPPGAFWVLANTFYWLFWLNFMIGATNALAMLPLDGGHIFKDLNTKILTVMHPAWPKKKVEKAARRNTIIMSVINLFLIIWLVIGPHVAAAFRAILGG